MQLFVHLLFCITNDACNSSIYKGKKLFVPRYANLNYIIYIHTETVFDKAVPHDW